MLGSHTYKYGLEPKQHQHIKTADITKGGESYAVHPQNVDFASGLVLLELAVRSDPHAPGFRPVTAAIPFSAVDSITYERLE